MTNTGRSPQLSYSESFKQMVVQLVENGTYSVLEVSRLYAINGKMTVYKWLDHYGRNKRIKKVVRVEKSKEQSRIAQLEAELKSAKEALANTVAGS